MWTNTDAPTLERVGSEKRGGRSLIVEAIVC
jgi:hypothetical protein